MNKYLKQNWKIFTKFKFRPQGNVEESFPRDADEARIEAEKIWNHLVNDEIKRHKFYIVKGRQGFTISVVSDDKYLYLVQAVRSELNTDEVTVFINDYTEDNLNDYCAVAKMIRYNIKDFIGHSRKGILELNKLRKAQEIKEDIDGDA